MILPDTSCWIHWIRHPDRLNEAGQRFQEFLTCGPILQEVLQGLDHSPYGRVTDWDTDDWGAVLTALPLRDGRRPQPVRRPAAV